MPRGSALGAVSGLALVLVAGGCGSSISGSSSSSTVGKVPAAQSTTTAVLRTAPAPLPTGTPKAPAGLAQTGGYDTYELCRGRCAGAVPASLRRPLHLPRPSGSGCPVSAGTTPVSVSGRPHRLAAQRFVGSRWLAARVTWRAAAHYTGPILIRGRRIDGAGAVGFGEGHRPYDELQLMDAGRGETGVHGRAWLSLTRVRQAGCYAYQIDGTTFSRVIVFRVRA